MPNILNDISERLMVNYYKFNFRSYLIEGKILPVNFLSSFNLILIHEKSVSNVLLINAQDCFPKNFHMKILVFIAGRSKIEIFIFFYEFLFRYCLKCCNFDHSRSLCEKNEEGKEFDTDLEIVENYDIFFKCPKCNFWNEKNQVFQELIIISQYSYVFSNY